MTRFEPSVVAPRLARLAADMLALVLLAVVADHGAVAAAARVAELAAPAAVPDALVALVVALAQRARRDRVPARRREPNGLVPKLLAGRRALAGRAEVQVRACVLADEMVGNLTAHCRGRGVVGVWRQILV